MGITLYGGEGIYHVISEWVPELSLVVQHQTIFEKESPNELLLLQERTSFFLQMGLGLVCYEQVVANRMVLTAGYEGRFGEKERNT